MLLQISNIIDAGVGAKERIMIKALDNLDIGKHLVLHSVELAPGRLSAKPTNIFWLPDQEVKLGDYILVYTGFGEKRNFINQAGSTTYVYYWGLKNTIFNSPKDSAVIMSIREWAYKTRD